jgi:hypothetical protein
MWTNRPTGKRQHLLKYTSCESSENCLKTSKNIEACRKFLAVFLFALPARSSSSAILNTFKAKFFMYSSFDAIPSDSILDFSWQWVRRHKNENVELASIRIFTCAVALDHVS